MAEGERLPHQARTWRATAIVFALLFLWRGIGFNIGFYVYDEGLILYPAELVLEGGVPYRDFLSLYGPAQYYVVAGLFVLFGPSLLVARIYGLATTLVLGLVFYRMIREVGSHSISLLSASFLLVWMGRFAEMPGPPTLVFVLLGATTLFPLFLEGRRPRLFAAGCLFAVAALFRHALGVAVFGSSLVAVACFRLFVFSGAERGERRQQVLEECEELVAGFLCVLAIPVIGLLLTVPLDDLWHNLVEVPFVIYPQVRNLPLMVWPPLLTEALEGRIDPLRYLRRVRSVWELYFVVTAGLLALGHGLFVCHQSSTERRRPGPTWVVLYLALLELVSLSQVTVRPDHWHFLPAVTMGLAVLSVSSYRRWRSVQMLVASLMILMLIFPIWKKIQITEQLVFLDSFAYLKSPRMRGIQVPQHRLNLDDCVRAVQQRSAPHEPIFMANLRHDVLSTNDILFYFITDRDAATRHFYFHPGVTTTKKGQEAIIRDLEATKPACVVLYLSKSAQPSEVEMKQGIVPGSRLLDQYLVSRYEPEVEFDFRVILRRKKTEAPSKGPVDEDLQDGNVP